MEQNHKEGTQPPDYQTQTAYTPLQIYVSNNIGFRIAHGA
jgi:hypothetical protein